MALYKSVYYLLLLYVGPFGLQRAAHGLKIFNDAPTAYLESQCCLHLRI